MDVPVFAAVGHPNKGKSSIVSTLSHDDSVTIGPLPGTTRQCRRYPMTLDGRTLYILVDTPGFQRPRKVYSWLLERETTAAGHPGAVREFLQAHDGDAAFRNECELLRPIMDGAGILYVVDGSVPYGREYEAEMEILRWTGQPRMALINPIGKNDYIEEWKAGLGQYFHMVRVFDAVMADFEKQVDLLRAFGQLREEWGESLERAVQALVTDKEERRADAARIAAETVGEMLTFQVERNMAPGDLPETLRADLEARFRGGQQALEGRCRDRIEQLYEHHRLTRVEDNLELLDRERLFSRETWRVFGLTRQQLVGFGALSGGAAGGLVDLSLGGASFLLGALLGAGIGAATTALAAGKLVEVKVLSFPLGRKVLTAGPTGNVNFPHVVFERIRLHHALVSNRAHARRDDLSTLEAVRVLTPPLPGAEKRELEQTFRDIRKGRDTLEAVARLARITEGVFASDARSGPMPRDPLL